MAIDFTKEGQAETVRSIGNSRIKVANAGHGTLGPILDNISNEDRLAMTKQGVSELLQGTIGVNKAKAAGRQISDKDILRARQSGVPLGEQRGRGASDKDIQRLEKVILKSISGKPLKTSITEEQQKKDKEEAETVFILLQRLLGGLNVEAKETATNE